MKINELLEIRNRIERLVPHSGNPDRFHEEKSAIMATIMRAVRSLETDARGEDVKAGQRQGSIRSMTFTRDTAGAIDRARRELARPSFLN